MIIVMMDDVVWFLELRHQELGTQDMSLNDQMSPACANLHLASFRNMDCCLPKQAPAAGG